MRYPFIVPDVTEETIDNFKKYIDEIYKSKVYSNGGKFVQRLEDFFTLQVEKECVVAANATLLLDAMHHFFRRDSVSLPAFTFPATNLARVGFGKTSIADCGSDGIAIHQPGHDVCVTTIPFGNPRANPKRPDCRTWVVDAAAGLDPEFRLVKRLLASGANLVIGSLHATKTLTAGEGGVAWGDEDLIKRLKIYQNFGFSGSTNNRTVSREGSNHKMSEFAAAFCLAYLDRDFSANYSERIRTADAYEKFCSSAGFNFIYSAQAFWFQSKSNALIVCEKFREAKVDVRRYYQPLMSFPGAVETPNAQKMSEHGICLPTRKFTKTERDELLRIVKGILCGQ